MDGATELNIALVHQYHFNILIIRCFCFECATDAELDDMAVVWHLVSASRVVGDHGAEVEVIAPVSFEEMVEIGGECVELMMSTDAVV